MNTLDDVALILQFVKGDGSFAANQSLRIEPAFDSAQLMAKRGGLVANLRQENGIPTVVVRRGSDYWNLIQHILLEQGFVPQADSSAHTGFARFQKQAIPEGYKLHNAAASVLWKEWWSGARFGNRQGLQMELLILTRNQWYPIRDIVCEQGALYIKTLGAELVYRVSDSVIWLRRIADPAEKSPAQLLDREALSRSVPPNKRQGIVRKMPPLSARGDQNSQNHEQEKVAPAELPPSMIDGGHSATFHPDLRQVMRIHQGKLYIMTAVGEVVVEGNQLKFWLNDQPDAAQLTPECDRGWPNRGWAANF